MRNGLMLTVETIIAKLGGPSAVAEATGASIKTVYSWPYLKGGLPSRYLKALHALAKDRKAKITFEMLATAAPGTRAGRARYRPSKGRATKRTAASTAEPAIEPAEAEHVERRARTSPNSNTRTSDGEASKEEKRRARARR